MSARRLSLRVALGRLAERRSVSFAHHGVGTVAAAHDPFALVVAPERFRRQLELLLGAGFRFVTVAELAEDAAGGEPRPGLAALSFDDGMRDNHDVVLPLLREYAIPATVYVATGLIGQPNPWLDPAAGERMMTAEEIRALAAAGVEIGAHTVTHPRLGELDRAACVEEMRTSRRTLEELLGAPVRTFAYPFGSWSEEAAAAAREVGFAAAVTCDERGSWRPDAMRRALLRGSDGDAVFALRLLGLHEPLFRSRPVAAARAATRGARLRARRRRAERALEAAR